MEALMNVLNKRTKIIQIATWVCAGLAFLGLFLPYTSVSYPFFGGKETLYLFSSIVDTDSTGALVAGVFLGLVLVGLAVVAFMYDSFQFVASIVLAGGAILAEIFYCSATFDDLDIVAQVYGKSIGGHLTTIFLIFLIIVSLVAVAAEVYLKYFAQNATATTQAKGWFCPQCGAPNEATGKFCNKCGTKKPE